MKKRCTTIMACLFLLTLADRAFTQPVVFGDVKARFSRSATDRRLIDKDADLILDDVARKLIVKSQEQPLEVRYDDIQKVVFDVSTRMRGGFMGAFGRSLMKGGGAAPALAGYGLSGRAANDHWCYLEYKSPDGSVRPYMLEIGKESSPKLIEKMQALLGDKVAIGDFAEIPEEIKKKTLKEAKSKHDLIADERNHPIPESKPEKALIVIVCPPAPRDAGKFQAKLHANDSVVVVNEVGTYSFVHLDPGEYLLVSQAGNASGFRMKLEAGQDYYFLQDTLGDSRTSLSRHTKELVMYELGGAHYSDWKRK
jgi:hypothetical protein